MKTKYLAVAIGLAVLGVIGAAVALLSGHNFAVLNPKGTIAHQQRDLIYFALALSLVIVVPVFAMLFGITWKYREGNPRKTKYTPNWDGSRRAETAWWTVPTVLIAILSVVTWTSSHDLDPFKPLSAEEAPMTIQVVALDWKWLFIYPDQDIATVNYVQFPANKPVRFQITADAPMNSFWIPQLGGQIYAMSGMSTQLNLMADGPGSYRGSSANISGKGFAGMKFTARSTSAAEFEQWVQSVKASPQTLSMAEYNKLARPTENVPQLSYSSPATGLYDDIIMKFVPPGSMGHMQMSGMDHSRMDHDMDGQMEGMTH